MTREQREYEAKEEAKMRLEQQVEYVAARLEEAGKASSPLRARFLAEAMMTGGDTDFDKWLATPPAKAPETPQQASPKAPANTARNDYEPGR